MNFNDLSHDGVILGGGLGGLSAAYTLSKVGRNVVIFERDAKIGGLAKTIIHRGFRFDLGGHRLIISSEKIERFVKEIPKCHFLVVPRNSKIYIFNKYFDYPLRAVPALFGLGLPTTLRIILDYFKERIKNTLNPPEIISLEDWVVNRFGRKMFDLYFKMYSEKVWGIDSKRISKDWLSQRIKGLSLWTAAENAFFRFTGKKINTLADKFIYPVEGIGQLSEQLGKKIEDQQSAVVTDTRVMLINCENFCVKSVSVKNGEHYYDVHGNEFISSIPLTSLIKMLRPTAPQDILEAVAQLKYRDLVVVTVMLNCEKVTDLTWMYLPEKNIPFGRVHEPKNWSPKMAPEGKTHIVAEYWSFKGDNIWKARDEELISLTVEHLKKLGVVRKNEVIDSYVVRVPEAYPLFEVGYERPYGKILNYLKNYDNLHLCGRGGLFRYYNMDHAIESGIDIAETILRKHSLCGDPLPCVSS